MNDLGHDKVFRVAHTIADLDHSDQIQQQHLNEAINYRMLDRQMWICFGPFGATRWRASDRNHNL